ARVSHDVNNGNGAGLPAGRPHSGNGALVPRDEAGSWNGAVGSELTAAATSKVNAIALLKALKKQWLLATCLGFTFAAVAAVGVWFFLPPAKEMAYARLLFRENGGEIFQRPEASKDFQSYAREQVGYLKSRLVLNAALNQPK